MGGWREIRKAKWPHWKVTSSTVTFIGAYNLSRFHMPTGLHAWSILFTANNNVSPKIPSKNSLSPFSNVSWDLERCIGNIPSSSQYRSTPFIKYNDIISKICFWTYQLWYISSASVFFQNTNLSLDGRNRILIFMSSFPAFTVFSTQNQLYFVWCVLFHHPLC